MHGCIYATKWTFTTMHYTHFNSCTLIRPTRQSPKHYYTASPNLPLKVVFFHSSQAYRKQQLLKEGYPLQGINISSTKDYLWHFYREATLIYIYFFASCPFFIFFVSISPAFLFLCLCVCACFVFPFSPFYRESFEREKTT